MNRRTEGRELPRFTYGAYAATVGMMGIAWVGWGPVWFGASLAPAIRANLPLVRTFGAFLVAVACFSAAIAMLPDSLPKRRAQVLFFVAHVFLLVVLALGARTMWTAGAANDIEAFIPLLFLVFGPAFFGRRQGPPWTSRLVTLFGGEQAATPASELRSRYERQIREAAGQEERNRLARELHDSIKQQVFAMQTAAATAQVRFDADPDGAKAAIDQVRASAREAMTEMEVMLDQLRAVPLENVGLIGALRKQCEALEFRTGVKVDFTQGALPPSEAFEPGAQQAIFRVAQEALANVARHARATRVQVSIDSAAGDFELIVKDDGVGFDPNEVRAGMGLANMRGRAAEYGGEFHAYARKGSGTKIVLTVPYRVDAPRRAARHLALALLLAAAAAAYSLVGRVSPTRSLLAVVACVMIIREFYLYVRERPRAGQAS